MGTYKRGFRAWKARAELHIRSDTGAGANKQIK